MLPELVQRKIHHGGKNFIGEFPSIKMNCEIVWEGSLELNAVNLLEYFPNVTAYVEQGRITHVWKNQRYELYPDFHALVDDKLHIIEVKPEMYVLLEKNRKKFRVLEDYAWQHGAEFHLWTETYLEQEPRLANIKKMQQFAFDEPTISLVGRILATLDQTISPISIEGIAGAILDHNPASVVAALMHLGFHHEIHIPVDEHPIDWDTLISLPRPDKEVRL